MHFLLTPVGSSGDVLPFIGIGRALRARHHDVTIIASQPFRRLSERAGLRFVHTHSGQDYDRFTRQTDLWHARRGPLLLLRAAAANARAEFARIEQAFQPGRTILVAHPLSFAARTFEEVHGVPAATVHLAPWLFRSDHQQPLFVDGPDPSSWPGWVKQLMWFVFDRWMLDPAAAPRLNTWRRELGLPPVSRIVRRWMNSARRIVGLFPEWFAPRQPDWPSQLHLTSFPLFDGDDGLGLDPELQDFLDRGSPPVLFTFGSANPAAGEYLATGLDAARRLGLRALFLTMYPEQLPPMGSDARHEHYVPFSAIIPRCKAVVHHGGIGTCAQALAAGVPQLVMPIAYDQPDNAARLARLGVGRKVSPKIFTTEHVAAELSALLQDAVAAERCRHWAAELRRHDPVRDTCALLEELSVA